MTPKNRSSAEGWPVDSDVGSEDLGPARPEHLRLHPRRIAVVLVGGFFGGLARYEVGTHWAAAAGTFPWATFAVNTAGAFILGLLVIVVLEVIGPSTYARPLIGAGFCGALTTFSSVAVGVDELAAHGHLLLGCGYLLASLAAGLTAVAVGAWVGRRLRPTTARCAMATEAG